MCVRASALKRAQCLSIMIGLRVIGVDVHYSVIVCKFKVS